MERNLDYYRLHLLKYLTEEGDPRKDDDSFLDARAEGAAREWECTRLNGHTADQAQEIAMSYLMEGLS